MDKKPTKVQLQINGADYVIGYQPLGSCESWTVSWSYEGKSGSGGGPGLITALLYGCRPVDLSHITLRTVLDWNMLLTVDMQNEYE